MVCGLMTCAYRRKTRSSAWATITTQRHAHMVRVVGGSVGPSASRARPDRPAEGEEWNRVRPAPAVLLSPAGGPVPSVQGRRLTCKYLLAYCCHVGDVFKALADPTRRRILDELTERNGQTLFEICSRLATKHRLSSSRQAISQHLEVLEAAGLVETERQGRYKFHHLNPRPLERIVDRWLQANPKETRCEST